MIMNSGIRLNRYFSTSYCLRYFGGEYCSSFAARAVNQKYQPRLISTHRSNSMLSVGFALERGRMKLDGWLGNSLRSYLLRCYSSNTHESFASDKYEHAFVSAVVCPDEIGIKFEDVAGLEYAKKALCGLVLLPITRPELFSHGNLLLPCNGILLFGPPGTGKTLLAKALATEAKANFINVTASLTSMWCGEGEKYAKALFSLARKLDPVIIFIDEIESLLVARGRPNENGSTRRLWNQFMISWDALQYKESKRIFVLGATSRPFDLDEAVISRMPRRIHVDLPNVENRVKILKVLLAEEDLESGFCFEQLAKATKNYSGSDLKNLCVAAADRPIKELREEEIKGNKLDGVQSLRPLKLDDFIHSKAKVLPSASDTSLIQLREWNDQYGEIVSDVQEDSG